MRNPFHWKTNNQKSAHEKGTQYKNATIRNKFTQVVNLITYNLGHNILELYKVLIQTQLTTSKTKRGI